MKLGSISKLVKGIAYGGMIATLIGCGGGGGSSDVESSPVATTAQIDSSIVIEGRAVKGVISNGLVNAYRIVDNAGRWEQESSPAGSTVRTDEEGNYSISLSDSYVGERFVIEVTADSETRMRCEIAAGCAEAQSVSFGQDFSLSDQFRLATITDEVVQGENPAAHITAYTQMVNVRANASIEGLSDLQVMVSEADIENMFGFAAGVLSLDPVDITDAAEVASASQDQIELALVSAALQEIGNSYEFDGIEDVIYEIDERLAQHNSLALTNEGVDPQVAIEEIMYSAQLVLEGISSTGIVIDQQISAVLQDGFSQEQQSASADAEGSSTADVSLSWDIPTEREDGQALELYEINGYRIAYGFDENSLNNMYEVTGAAVTEQVFEDMNSGVYYFAIATVDSDNVQGNYSDTIQVVIN